MSTSRSNSQALLKIRLFDLCDELLMEKIETMKAQMNEAQLSANEESKSSVGDKYETGRAMMQLEKEKVSGMLENALKLQKALKLIRTEKLHENIQPGSVIITDKGNFFLSVSVGPVNIDGKEFMAISPVSPIGKELNNKKEGDSIMVNGNLFSILEVY